MEENSKKLKVCIFGEDSLLGRSISDILEKDYDILNSYSHLANFPRQLMSSLAWGPEIDATNESCVEALVLRADIIINCVGLVNTDKCLQNIYGAYQSNILAAEVVAKYCQMYNKKLVHLATTASYSSSTIITEETSPAIFQTMYSGSKLLGETIVKYLCPQSLIIRPCFVYGGKRDTSSIIKKLIYKTFRFKLCIITIS